MKRVYLDQNKWIELLAAAKGKNDELVDLLRLATMGVQIGEVSLPLSYVHYMETGHRREWKGRWELAGLMAELSRFHTMAYRGTIVACEIDAALHRRFGRPTHCPKPRVFGYGIGHVLPRTGELADAIAQAQGFLQSIGNYSPGSPIRDWFELEMLRGPDANDEADMPDYDPLAPSRAGDQWARDREDLRELRRNEGWLRGERSKDLFHAETLISEEAIWDRADMAGIAPDEIIGLGKEGLSGLVDDIPTLHVTCELGRLRDVADVRPLSGHDLADVGFLGSAVAYCDVVVTENQWADFAKRAGLEERYATRVISDLGDLMALVL